jgi:hypothetical protein
MRTDIVIVVGRQVFHYPQSLEKRHAYEKILVYPRRREPNVWVYYLATTPVGNGAEEYVSYLLGWPYRWVRGGSKWALLFPAAGKLPVVPVKGIPSDLSKPVKVGPPQDLSHRGLVQHAQDTRVRRSKKAYAAGNRHWRDYRFPNRGRLNPETIYWNLLSGGESYGVPWTESYVQTPRYYRAYSSVNTPGFKKLRKGSLPVNPYSLTLIKTEDQVGHDIRFNGYPGGGWGPQHSSKAYQPSSVSWCYLPPAPQHDNAAYNRAITKCIDRSNSGIVGNLAQDLVQGNQLVRMVGDSAHRIAMAATACREKRFRRAWDLLTTPSVYSRGLGYRTNKEFGVKPRKRTKSVYPRVDLDVKPGIDFPIEPPSALKSVSENWLALQYGWKPLLSDIYGALESLATLMTEQDPIVIRTVRGKAETISKLKQKLYFASGNVHTGWLEVTTYSTCKVGLRYTVDSQLKAFLSQTGFTTPINLAWEVLPYSFVVDWFIPIGPYLESMAAFDGLKFVDGFVTKATTQYTSSMHSYKGIFPWEVYPQWPYLNTSWDFQARVFRQYVRIDRTKLWSFPGLTLPEVKNPFSVIHALNGLALLRAAFK